MPSEDWALAALVAATLAAAVTAARVVRSRRRRIPTRRRLADVRDGVLRFDAVVLPGATTLSPFTGEPCVYWRGTLEVFEDRRQLTAIPDSGSWRLVWVGAGGTPFDVDDGTALARIDACQGAVEVSFGEEHELDPRTPLPDTALARLEEDEIDLPVGVRLRYREARLVAGARVTIAGRIKLTLDPTSTAERLHRQDPILRSVFAEPEVEPFLRML